MNIKKYSLNINQIKNFLIEDPILDWLNEYGTQNGFERDGNTKDDFRDFISNKTNVFKKNIINKIQLPFVVIDKQIDLRQRCCITLKNIIEGKYVILNPEFFDNENYTYGNCDIIVRSDKINQIFQNNIFDYKYQNEGCIYHTDFHYVIINLHCVKLKLLNNFTISNTKKNIFIKTKNIFLNNVLSKIQRYKTETIFIIGEEYQLKEQILSNDNCCCSILHSNETELELKLYNGLKWLKDLHLYGKDWCIYPPSRKELYPNMCNNNNDYNWHNTKKEIAIKLNEITLLWGCGIKQREQLHEKGICHWKDKHLNVTELNLNINKTSIIKKMIDVNYLYENNICIYPRKIKKKQNLDILHQKEIEFIVDFETINMNQDGKYFEGIFMIGCLAVIKQDKTIFKQYTLKELNENDEKYIVNQWLQFMNNIETEYNVKNSKIFHWGKAEQNIYNKMKDKYCLNTINFIDLLSVFNTEPVIIKDAFSYGLKDIVKSLHKHNIINEIWEDDMNGKEAMIKAWQSYNGKDNSIMKNIEKYNYYDCKVIVDILNVLRKMT